MESSHLLLNYSSQIVKKLNFLLLLQSQGQFITQNHTKKKHLTLKTFKLFIIENCLRKW